MELIHGSIAKENARHYQLDNIIERWMALFNELLNT